MGSILGLDSVVTEVIRDFTHSRGNSETSGDIGGEECLNQLRY
jgi:hypothetical protein